MVRVKRNSPIERINIGDCEMKTKQHKAALIAKKCMDLKYIHGFDAFFNFEAHVDKIEVSVYKKWDAKLDPLYTASCCLDGGWNSFDNASSLDDIIDNLNSIVDGLGRE